MSYSVTGGATWQPIAYVITDNDGNFICMWLPSASGYYGIEATWSGNSFYSGVSATYNFAVAPFNNQNENVFSVTSNSTLTSLTFDSTTDELSFGVSGPSGTTGLTEVCIPQSLIPDISKLNVILEGSTINYASVSDGNVWIITFTYHHSSHAIVIALAAASTPTPTPSPTSTPTSAPTTTPIPTATSIPTTAPSPTPAATLTASPSTSPTSSTSPTPSVPEFPMLIILPLFAIVILLSIVFLRKLEVNDSWIPRF